MRLFALSGTTIALLCAFGPATADAWQEIEGNAQRMAQIYGPWPPKAFEDFTQVQECLKNNSCSRSPCDPIETQLDWLGAYCRADVAKHNGDDRKASKEFENAFRALLKHYPTEELFRTNPYVTAAARERAQQPSQQFSLTLANEVNSYASWRFSRAQIAKKEQQDEQLRLKAEGGDPGAQVEYAVKLYRDRSKAENMAEAAVWLRKAAEQGHADAQNSLGFMYAKGEGVAEDDTKAVAWYRKAAEQGQANAQHNLGVAYEKGHGVAKDDTQAVAWYRRAAEQGQAEAQYNLGNMYRDGRGIAKDDSLAVAWYRKAAEQGYAAAQYFLGFMYENGHGVEKDDTQAFTWYSKASLQGHADARNIVGMMYAIGQGVAKDDEMAFAAFQGPAAKGHANAQYNLGLMYANGQGVTKDDAQAAEWYGKSAAQGNELAQHNLAHLYRNGHGVERALVTAYAWMNLSAAGGHENAPAERDEIAAKLSAADLAKAQKLSREWKPGQLIPVVSASVSARPSQKPAAAIRTTSSSNGLFPARPAKVPGRTSCNTRCMNADCYRTYDDGRQEHFQAQRKLNAFGEWEWDSGSC